MEDQPLLVMPLDQGAIVVDCHFVGTTVSCEAGRLRMEHLAIFPRRHPLVVWYERYRALRRRLRWLLKGGW